MNFYQEDKHQIKSHSENFNLDILKIRKIKNKDVADSNQSEGFVTSEEALEFYSEDNSYIVDQNSRKLPKKNESKNLKKSQREKALNKRVYLPLVLQEYVSQFGREKRKNASVGIGIKYLIEMFIPMKKRNDHQVKRIILLLNQLDLATNEIAAFKMKNSTENSIENAEKKRMGLCLDIVYHLNLFGFTQSEINQFLNESQKMLLKNALDKYEIFKMEKNLEEIESNFKKLI